MAVPLTKSPLADRVMRRILNQAERKARNRIGSSQLTNALTTNVGKQTKNTSTGYLNVPHYWAKYYHSGRGQVTPKRSSVLIWFRNPKQDPRLQGGRYPVTKAQRRYLTRDELKKWSTINQKIVSEYKKRTGKRILSSTDYMRMRLPMIVAKQSPREGSKVKTNPFFSNEPNGGMYGFDRLAGQIAEREVYNYVEERLKKTGLKNKTINRFI